MSSASLTNKVIQFFAGLLPNFERSRIVEDVDMLRNEVKDNLLPAFKQAASLVAGKKFVSKLVDNFNEVFLVAMPEFRRVGYFGAMVGFYTSMADKLDLIDKLIPDLFAKDVTKDSITYRKASVLQYLSAVRFANEYSSRVLLRLLSAEQNAVLNQLDLIDTQLSPAEIKWLDDNLQAYLQTIKLLSMPVKDLAAAIQSTPDITIVPERYSQVAQTVGVQNLDPLKLGLINANWNPIYHIRSFIAELQVKSYQRDKETKRALELKLLALKEAYSGKQDARVQQQITYIEGRLQRLNHDIAEFEQQAN